MNKSKPPANVSENVSADVLTYVKASAALHALVLDEASAQRVAQHLERTASMAQLLQEADLAPDDELAEIYSPLAFKTAYIQRKQL